MFAPRIETLLGDEGLIEATTHRRARRRDAQGADEGPAHALDVFRKLHAQELPAHLFERQAIEAQNPTPFEHPRLDPFRAALHFNPSHQGGEGRAGGGDGRAAGRIRMPVSKNRGGNGIGTARRPGGEASFGAGSAAGGNSLVSTLGVSARGAGTRRASSTGAPSSSEAGPDGASV